MKIMIKLSAGYQCTATASLPAGLRFIGPRGSRLTTSRTMLSSREHPRLFTNNHSTDSHNRPRFSASLCAIRGGGPPGMLTTAPPSNNTASPTGTRRPIYTHPIQDTTLTNHPSADVPLECRPGPPRGRSGNRPGPNYKNTPHEMYTKL
ncbi:uncharacterized protein LOC131438649 [Malaya genurostris]|uniref:uncharacterized protein LOC131438649 n=1 Tax=Malaya genurostris TaxID=325434 RepID=UPI0026F3A589|nr:uncharacterized protein LOC131438649 [Malaya genurostris]